jgi:hypothetical protein
MRIRYLGVIPLVCLGGPILAGDLAAPTLAKFIRVLMQSTTLKAVACADKELAGELGNLGVALDPEAKLAWTENEKDIGHLARQGKLVICGNRAFLAAGASIAVINEGGRPAFYINIKNLAGTGITLPDNIMKIAKVAQ